MEMFLNQSCLRKDKNSTSLLKDESAQKTVSVNYDDFVNDVEVGDILLVNGGMMSLALKSKTKDLVKC